MFKSIIGGSVAIMAVAALSAGEASAKGTLSTEALYRAGKQAYVYGFPLYEMFYTRSGALAGGPGVPAQELNRVTHSRKLIDDKFRLVTAPNNDTLYSMAWLDLRGGPVALAVPDTKGRYYSIAFLDFYTNNAASVGRRTTGTGAGRFLLAGPTWQGTVPEGATLVRLPTNAVWMLVRILVDGPADLPAVHALQDQITLTPSAEMVASAEERQSVPAVPKDPQLFYDVLNAALAENPPPARDAAMLQELAPLGIGPGRHVDWAALGPEGKATLARAMTDAQKDILASQRGFGTEANGWRRLSAAPDAGGGIGNYGTNYTLRAMVALIGLGALEPQEASYLPAVHDSAGQAFNGSKSYELRFPAGALPPVGAFWSLSMYEIDADRRLFFTANPLGRYTIGDRTPGLKREADGSLVIEIQATPPSDTANWLPSPAGPFSLMMRAYQPDASIIDGRYQFPAVTAR